MSEFRDIAAAIVTDRLPGSGEDCILCRTGQSFVAEVAETPDVELNEALGRDARESVMIYISDRALAAQIRLGPEPDRILIRLFGAYQKFMVLRRKDNPSSPQVEFGLMKVVSEKDAD